MSIFSSCIVLLLCSAAVVFARFRVLRGGNQPTHDEMTMSNTARLMPYAALTGEKATIMLRDENQTAIVQHHVNVVIDCSPLIQTGGRLLSGVKWTRQSYYPTKDGSLSPKGSEITIYPGSSGRLKAEGTLNHILNISSTNIIKGAEKDDNGMYTCSFCNGDDCLSASVMLFLIGAPPRMKIGSDNSQAEKSSFSFVDKKYHVGADFCVERGSEETFELSCEILGENLTDHISIPFPTPSRKWFKDNVLFYSVDKIGQSIYRGTNPNFYSGPNGILTYGIVDPSPLYASRQGQIVMAFEASELVYPDFAPAGMTNETVVDDVFNALTGKWRCEVENMHGRWMAETVITEC